MTTAAICTIGDELVAGEVVDSNSAWLATALTELGLDVRVIVSIGDGLDALTTEVARLVDAHDVVICSGGLGPTSDDRTREAVAAAVGVDLERSDELAERLRAWFASHGVDEMPEANLQQADVPVGATVLAPKGTAPGFSLPVGDGLVAALPGVPWELQAMFRESLEPLLVARDGIRPAVTRVVHVSGLGESACAARLADLEQELPDAVEIGYLAGSGELKVKFTARGDHREAARAMTEAPVAKTVDLLGEHVIGLDGGSLEEVVIARYAGEGMTIAVAESASSGILADRLASPSGASTVFLGGAAVYSADAKVRLAGVDQAVIDEHGTVSRETTEALAVAIRERLGADVGAATTGVAGPEPVEGHPSGTIIWAVATADGVRSWQRQLPGDRRAIRQRLATAALEALRRAL